MSTILVAFLLLALYFLPWLCAQHKHKRNQASIFVLNLFLGWTLIGWVVALVWALSVDSVQAQQQVWLCSICRSPLQPTSRFCDRCGVAINWTGSVKHT
jgi:hypothetical protein